MKVESLATREIDRAPPEEDRLRANLYMLLAGLLSRAPDRDVLAVTGQIGGNDAGLGGSELGGALATLARIASRCDEQAVAREYHDLFIGVGRGELVPFASYYLTGFLNEKPLAVLRGDMAWLGMARPDGVKEPEDHIAALLDMMGGLITGAFGAPASLAAQKRFFHRHVAPWAGHFFRDLEAAKASMLYAAVGTLGRVFIAIEAQAFEMD